MKTLGRGIAALIRDVNIDCLDDTHPASLAQPHSHLTPPELRARIRESLLPVFFDDSATIARKIEAAVNPLRNDLTLSSFANLRGGKLYDYDTKRMNAFRTPTKEGTKS